MDFLELLKTRYTTKYYDETKVVPDDVVHTIMECVRLTPTSVNSQPYHFYICTGESKAKLRDAIMDFNQKRFDSASHAVVISVQKRINDEHLSRITAQEDQDGRFSSPELKTMMDQMRRQAAQSHVDQGDYLAWTKKNSYISFATIVYAAAAYGVQSTALEGVEFDKVDEIMQLDAKGETCSLIVLLGYASDKDSNTIDKRPKSRLPLDYVATYLQ